MSTLISLFDEAEKQFLNEKWTVLNKTQNWWEILPCPDLTDVYRFRAPFPGLLGIRSETESEQKLQWQLWAMDLFKSKKSQIRFNVSEFEKYLAQEVETWNNKNHRMPGMQLSLSIIFNEWIQSINHLTVDEFTRLYIWSGVALKFITPKFEEKKSTYSVPNFQKVEEEKDYLKTMWLDDEATFWKIISTYGNDFIEEVDGKITWKIKVRSNISYLAGFTKVCIDKDWMLQCDGPDYVKLYCEVFNVAQFDPKPFKPNGLSGLDPKYEEPFKGIKRRFTKSR